MGHPPETDNRVRSVNVALKNGYRKVCIYIFSSLTLSSRIHFSVVTDFSDSLSLSLFPVLLFFLSPLLTTHRTKKWKEYIHCRVFPSILPTSLSPLAPTLSSIMMLIMVLVVVSSSSQRPGYHHRHCHRRIPHSSVMMTEF